MSIKLTFRALALRQSEMGQRSLVSLETFTLTCRQASRKQSSERLYLEKQNQSGNTATRCVLNLKFNQNKLPGTKAKKI